MSIQADPNQQIQVIADGQPKSINLGTFAQLLHAGQITLGSSTPATSGKLGAQQTVPATALQKEREAIGALYADFCKTAGDSIFDYEELQRRLRATIPDATVEKVARPTRNQHGVDTFYKQPNTSAEFFWKVKGDHAEYLVPEILNEREFGATMTFTFERDTLPRTLQTCLPGVLADHGQGWVLKEGGIISDKRVSFEFPSV